MALLAWFNPSCKNILELIPPEELYVATATLKHSQQANNMLFGMSGASELIS